MGYKWRPSKAQAREFAERMNNDPEYAAAYNARKELRIQKRQESSKFDYETRGGEFIPTREQHDFAFNNMHLCKNVEEETAFNQVMYGYSCQEKVHHDFIHIVNEYRRKAV